MKRIEQLLAVHSGETEHSLGRQALWQDSHLLRYRSPVSLKLLQGSDSFFLN